MTLHEVPFKKDKEHAWYCRFCFKSGLKGSPVVITRAFAQPFSHPLWCGPFKQESDAVQCGHDAFVDFINLPVINSRDNPM